MNKVVTDFLTPQSSPLTGAGTILNIAGAYYFYNISKTPAEADRRAIASDWAMVGQDIREVFNQELKAREEQHRRQLQLAL